MIQSQQYFFCRTRTTKQNKPVAIYFHFSYYGDNAFQLLKYCIHKIKVNCNNNQPVVFKTLNGVGKMKFFATPKIEALLSIKTLLCTSSHIMAVVQTMQENRKNNI